MEDYYTENQLNGIIQGTLIRQDSLMLDSMGYELKKAMTISGRYEGLYAWLAENCIKRRLISGDSTLGESYGIIEIGGASMQITFAAKKGEGDINRISRGKFSIYSKSYLRGGVNEVYKRYSQKKQFDIGLEDKSELYGDSLKFIGLGMPIKVLLDTISDVGKIKQYADSLPDNDTPENYHPKTNALYIAWLVEKLKLEKNLEKQAGESDWTKGAALDILVNKEEDPEAFDYQAEN